jgi:4'-phosphopantetheinyl transferase
MPGLDPGVDLAAQGIDLRLWLVDLDAAGRAWPDLLDAAELERASRLLRDLDRRRYIASHAALRRLLGTDQAWRVGEHGKPALVSRSPHFNLSRRDGHALIGLSATHEIGVDVESLRPFADAQALAELHFTAAEREGVMAASGAAREQAFLLGWTRKEACVKALGTGLSLPPSSFECGVQALPARVRIGQRELLVHSPASAAAVVVSWAVVMA